MVSKLSQVAVTYEGRQYRNGDMINVTLNSCQTLQLQADSGDMTGTRVQGSQKIAVFRFDLETIEQWNWAGVCRKCERFV